MTKVLIAVFLSGLFFQTAIAHETDLAHSHDQAESLGHESQLVLMEDEVDSDSSVLSPEHAEKYLDDMQYFRKLFPQTLWNECSDYVTGNYSGYKCSTRRGISVILKDFMEDHFLTCTNEALKSFNGKTATDLHVIHDGIQGDANHSPRSLHAEARAIDVDSMIITYGNGSSEKVTFKGSNHASFFKSFRSCWGSKVSKLNGCPIVSGGVGQTGSIGKEDRNHQNHVHISVPYCVSGKYGSGFFQR